MTSFSLPRTSNQLAQTARKTILLKVFIVLSVLMYGCSSETLTSEDTAENAEAAGSDSVRLVMGTTPHFANAIVAQELDFWRDNGLDVDVTIFNSGGAAAEAFRAGRGDFLIAGDFPSMSSWQLDDIFGVAPQARVNGLSIVVGGPDVDQVSDLAGKRVGVWEGSTSEYFYGLIMESEGLTREDADAINLAPADMVSALDRGDLDAFIIWQPFGWESERITDGANIITTSEGFFQEYQLVSTRESVDDATIVAFLRGLDEAGAFIDENQSNSVGLVSRRLNLDAEMTANMIDALDWRMMSEQRNDDDVRQDLDDLAEFYELSVDWDSVYRTQYMDDM